MSNISLSGHDFWKTFCSVQTIDVWVADEEHSIWSYIWQKRMSPKQLCLVWYKLLKIFRVFNTKGWIGNGIWGSDLSCSLENTQILEKENSYKTREGKPCQTREVRTRIKPGKENRVKPEKENSIKPCLRLSDVKYEIGWTDWKPTTQKERVRNNRADLHGVFLV